MNNEEKPLSPENAVLREIHNTRATVGQIAQLAATLSHAHPKNTAVQLTEKALKLWQSSRTLLYTSTRDEFHNAEFATLQDDNMDFIPRCKFCIMKLVACARVQKRPAALPQLQSLLC